MVDHRVGDEMSKARLADPLKARILLMTGGIFGLHRFYLDEIPEAFIFFSTGGVFLLGVVYDSFYINKYVDLYNMKKLGEVGEIKKFKNGKLLANLSKMVRFSLLRFSTSVAYAVWLGFLCWLAGSVMLGRIEYGSLVMTSALAAAVAIGGPALSFVAYSSHSRRRNTLFDVELVDKAPLWADMVAVFIIDMLYQEVRVLEKRSVIEPLQWALWRVYLIVKFDAPAFISQPELKRTCLQWIRKQTNSSNKRDFTEKKKESRDYHFLGISRGCDIMTK
ncbi:TM2 domain protein [Dictyocaulus viviparus]|uniref:TM2 domain protein n=1 Tax=Dictyocaulus viviparus TaxID=29172 RepID=A0A0D8XWG0_DICVI|nr:TM2 domain protein [Dictyocaulus viviparus]